MTEDLLTRLRAFEGRSAGEPSAAPDPVNLAMIRHWCEAIGDENPVYLDAAAAAASAHGRIIAPPTMLQAWIMRGIKPRPAAGGTPTDELMALLDEHGFTSVVATNCEQDYARDLHLGDHLSLESAVESVSEEKRTALGVGHFVTTRLTYRDQSGDVVATMLFRILKFRPPAPTSTEQRAPRPRPAITKDSQFWFDAARRHELVIQRCTRCERLRHPPAPMCRWCGSLDWDAKAASGRATVYSFVVNHHPQVPAFDYPLVVALVELEEGTRLVTNLVDVAPEDVEVGMAVSLTWADVGDDLSLPQFRPRTD